MAQLLVLIVFIFFLWLIWQIAWRTIAWVLKPAADYFDEKEKRDEERTRTILTHIDSVVESNTSTVEMPLKDPAGDVRKITCPRCGAELDPGAIESFVHGESGELRCSLCDAQIDKDTIS
jgi:hypothetical protein